MSYCILNFWPGYSDRKLIRQTDHVIWTQIHITWTHKNYQLCDSLCFWKKLDLKDEITGKGAENEGQCEAQTNKAAAAFKCFSS